MGIYLSRIISRMYLCCDVFPALLLQGVATGIHLTQG